jgi:hypothetical protein
MVSTSQVVAFPKDCGNRHVFGTKIKNAGVAEQILATAVVSHTACAMKIGDYHGSEHVKPLINKN